HDAGTLERIGLVWLAAGCILLGLFPAWVLRAIDQVNLLLLDRPLMQTGNWFWLAPLSPERASYSPVVVVLVGLLVIGLTAVLTHRVYAGRTRRSAPWDCGAPGLNARMQDSAEGLGQPIRRVFTPFFLTRVELPRPDDAAPRYRVSVDDRFWSQLYLPLAGGVLWLARQVGKIQQGRVSVYLLYSFLTLLALLLVVVR
ncbi:MAG: hydrogenase 4 subunit B, partial [Thiomonas sp.]